MLEYRRLFELARQILVDKLGPDHPFVAENLEQYARLLRKLGEDEEAAALEVRARAIRDKNG